MKYIYLPSVISFTLIIFFGEFSLKSRIVFWLPPEREHFTVVQQTLLEIPYYGKQFSGFRFQAGRISFQFLETFFPASIVFITVSFTNKKRIFEEEIFHNDITSQREKF